MADGPGAHGHGDEDREGDGFFGRGSGGRSGGGSGGQGSGGRGSGGQGSGGDGSGGDGDTGPGSVPNPNDPAAMFAELNKMLGGQAGGAGLEDLMAQLQQAFSQLGAGGGGMGRMSGLFGGGGAAPEGGVNWTLAKDTARKASAQLGPDPTPTATQLEQVREAVSIADVWLDDACRFPRVAGQPLAWSRADWIEQTQKVWQRLVEPVASSIADAMEQAMTPGADDLGAEGAAQLQGLEQMFKPMVRASGASMFGAQLGQALAQLANEVVGATDVGLPLHDRVALLPANVAKFGEGLDQSETDVRLYLALRECARQRLFHGTSWLRSHLLTLVEEYARGITIDTSALESAVADLDLSNLEELNTRLAGELFTPQRTPEQQAVLVRLETMLALVEGWVDEVVTQATARWMPAAVPLAETMRRQRATGGPAEATFASLVGLELRPRRLRDAANLWAALRDDRDVAGRDAVWEHPDVIPATADLDDPIGFVRRTADGAADQSDVDFDSELAKLLDGATGGPEPTDPEPDPGPTDPGPSDGPSSGDSPTDGR